MTKINTQLLLLFAILIISSCNREDDCSSPTKNRTKNLEEIYGCENTKEQMNVDLNNDYIIVRSQQSFNEHVMGNCNPQIDFEVYDLVIGKKMLTTENRYIDSFLSRNCNNPNRISLQVIFYQNEATESQNLTYHALIPKLNSAQNIIVDISESRFSN